MDNKNGGKVFDAEVVKEKRARPKTKLAWFILALAVLYTIFPIDLIPDAPIVGWIDDFLIDLAAIANLARKYKRR